MNWKEHFKPFTDRPFLMMVLCAVVFISAITLAGISATKDHKELQRRLKEDPERYENENERRARMMFKAWCKETDNPKGLTLEEFKALKLHQSAWDGTYNFKD